MTRFSLAATGLYLVLMAALIAGLMIARRKALQTFDTAQSRTQWEDWRAEVEKQDEANSPVARRVPPSVEPPTLVLLRDHFGVCFAGAVVLTTVLYWFSALLVRGAFWGHRFDPDRS